MYADVTKPAAGLPQPQLTRPQRRLSLLLPLSRRGHGPGLIVLVSDPISQLTISEGLPSPLWKWAEEGYTVVEIQASFLTSCKDAIGQAISLLNACDQCTPKGKIGLIVYDPELWNQTANELPQIPSLVGAVIYADAQDKADLAAVSIPVLQHLAGGSSNVSERMDGLTKYYYPPLQSHKFATPSHGHFNYASEAVSHTRNLSFLKPLVGGPYFDLEAIWDEHTYYEFADRSVEHTMNTMVQEPYVNHVPTITGGIGRGNLTKFYRDNFIFNNSADTELELISRTVGIDRVIDEFIFKFTHDRELDWLLPGVPPTGKWGEVPFTAVVNIRGDRLYHEHISWDQGTALRQMGLLPEFLPFPYPLPDGRVPGHNKVFEYQVPVAGVQTADKMRDKNSVPSNEMFNFKIREVDSEATMNGVNGHEVEGRKQVNGTVKH